jgi:uroporphyrinogen-III synthase
MSRPLEGCRVALAEGRQLEELAGMLEREGATPLRYPMVSILDAPDPAPVVAWLRELAAGRFAYVVLLTGEGLRRLLGFAEREGMREGVLAALAKPRIVTRGPKPVQALRAVGLAPTLIAEAPTTEGVIATLRREPLAGRAVGVQLYSPENRPLTEFLAAAGATAYPVLPYVYAPAADADRVVELIDRLDGGSIDVIVFTSSPQVVRLYEVAGQAGREDVLRRGLGRVRVAAVGPVVADTLRQNGVEADICPEQGFVMKNLVQQIRRRVGEGET